MSQKINMNVFLHSILVIQDMDNFTVTEARDILLREHSEFTNPTEARKYVYRQLLWAINKNLLKRTDHFEDGVKIVLYAKTDSFFALTFSPTRRGKKQNKTRKVVIVKPTHEAYQPVLEKELMAYEVDLTAIIEEANEYKRLSARFPDLQGKLQEHQLQAKKQSTQLLGRINALQKLLGYKISEDLTC